MSPPGCRRALSLPPSDSLDGRIDEVMVEQAGRPVKEKPAGCVNFRLGGAALVPASYNAAAFFRGAQPMGLQTVHFTTIHTPMLGTRLGPWVIDKELGRGGMGQVYLAHADPAPAGGPGEAAIKILAPELAAEAGFRHRFQ